MSERIIKYQTKKQIKIGVLTWNLAGHEPLPEINISDLLLP